MQALVISVDDEPYGILGRNDEIAAITFRDKLLETFNEFPLDEPVTFTVKKVNATEEDLQTKQDW